MTPLPTHAGGIVHRADTGRVLLVRARPAPHDWVLPKGRIEAGETPEQTAVREVREEAGVEATVIERLGEIEMVKPNGRDARVVCFLMRFVREVPADEDREILWCSLDEAVGLVPFENTRTVFEAARTLLPKR